MLDLMFEKSQMNENVRFLAECADLRLIDEDSEHYQLFAEMVARECLNMIHCATLTNISHQALDKQIRDYFGIKDSNI